MKTITNDLKSLRGEITHFPNPIPRRVDWCINCIPKTSIATDYAKFKGLNPVSTTRALHKDKSSTPPNIVHFQRKPYVVNWSYVDNDEWQGDIFPIEVLRKVKM